MGNRNFYSRHYPRERHQPTVRPELMQYDLKISAEELSALVRLLEMAEADIQRTFKRLSTEDIDMKEITWYYRVHGRRFRNKLRQLRGY